MTSLRKENPLIDSDLTLIIRTFESSMVKSRDENSSLVLFRRDLDGMEDLPQSILDSANTIPSKEGGESSDPITEDRPLQVMTDDGDWSKGNFSESSSPHPGGSSEDGDDDLDVMKAVSDWMEECAPCDFRIWSKFSKDFFKDMAMGSWDKMLDRLDLQIDKFLSLFQNDDAILREFCNYADLFRTFCIPDLQKLLFLLSWTLGKMETEISINIASLDDFLYKVLGPILNEMISNLSLIKDIAVGPIVCMINQLRLLLSRSGAITKQTVNLMGQTYQTGAAVFTSTPTSAEQAEQRRQARQERIDETFAPAGESLEALETVEGAVAKVEELASLRRVLAYIQEGKNKLEHYRKQLLDMLQDITDEGFDSWNNKFTFAKRKMELLRLINMLKSIIFIAKAGDLHCGPDSEALTPEDVTALANSYQPTSASSTISVENGNLILSRMEPPLMRVSGTSKPSRQSVDLRPGETRAPVSNIVFSKPISSCIKKVKSEEVDQVSQWIRELEEDIN